MPTATMTSKGQITVPKDVREVLGLRPGSKVVFVDIGGGQYRLLARTGELSALSGALHRPGQAPLTLEQMDEAIAEGAIAGSRPSAPDA